MRQYTYFYFLFISSILILTISCSPADQKGSQAAYSLADGLDINNLLDQYTSVKLTADLSKLATEEKKAIKELILASKFMDRCFWYDAYGNNDSLMMLIGDSLVEKYAAINYGPWDRLNGNKSFISEVGPKPKGANFYPPDMTKEEFEVSVLKDKADLYTYIRRDSDSSLISIPYHEHLKSWHDSCAVHLENAQKLTSNTGLKRYLGLRAMALRSDEYRESDLAWLDMKDNHIDVVIGPIETYEDQLFGYKAAHEAYVLIKDMDWSERLAKYAAFLPELQTGLPVPEEYKQETPGTDTELNAYDVIYYSGDCNAGSKTIAINLPNDETVQLEKGTRRLQLKNAMRAKFDKILIPIANKLIDSSQLKHIHFEAFFANTMFHEVAHGLGIKNLLDGSTTVRKALKEHASALEEGKADILGLYMIMQLHEKGEIDGDIMDYYVTFMAGIFRSVRFGASSAHGKANMIRFNFFEDQGAFKKNESTGRYNVEMAEFERAVKSLSELILRIQGDGDYARASNLIETKAQIGQQLQADLDRLSKAGIPVDIVFEQGIEVLGL